MRPYQLATMVVMAHPWVPETGPILDLLAQAQGEPTAEALMGIDRVPGTRGIGSWTLEWTGTFASSLTCTVLLLTEKETEENPILQGVIMENCIPRSSL